MSSPTFSPSAVTGSPVTGAEGASGLQVVVLAAGQGTRMKSRKPKVLQGLAGRPLLGHVLATALSLAPARIVVVAGHGADQVQAYLAHDFAAHLAGTGPAPAGDGSFATATGATGITTALQQPQLGTGHAVQQALTALDAKRDSATLILYGDVPLTRADTLRQLLAAAAPSAQAPQGSLAVLTIELDDPTGYGRIVRDGAGQVRAIVEHKDATPAERALRETNTGLMAVPDALLRQWLGRIGNDNAQGEYYLTDIVALAVADGVPVQGVRTDDALQVAGVNSPAQLAALERSHQLRQAEQLLAQGVRLADPARLDVRGELRCGQDVEIDINCIFNGRVTLGDGVRIGAHCVIGNAEIAAGAVIHPYTHIDGEAAGVQVGAESLIGPFARLRPGATLGRQVHIGNFVEVKNSTLADGAKANHLAYLGDATVGERVNYGAGSITANYDGANKHRTQIGADVHIGSNSVLVAPISIGAGGTVGAGSVVTRDAPPAALTVSRARPATIPNWQRPAKTPKAVSSTAPAASAAKTPAEAASSAATPNPQQPS